MPETSVAQYSNGGSIFSVEVRHLIPADEVSPDVIALVSGLMVGALEGECEAHNVAADWESIIIETFRRDTGLLIQARVKPLTS